MLSFTNAPQNLFNVLGKVGALVKNLKAYQTLQLTAMTDTTSGVVAQLNNESDIQAILGNAYIGILSSAGGNIGGTGQAIAEGILNRKVFRDNPQLNQTLTSFNTPVSIQEVIRQMKVAGATVLAMSVAANPIILSGQPGPQFRGTGNGVIVTSVKRPLDGLVLENSFAENLLVLVNSDSYSNTATAGNESSIVTGTGNQSDVFAFNWPLGSNATSSLTAIDGRQNNAAGNLLTNSSWGTWSGGAPSNWLIDSGSTRIFQENTITFGTDSALRITGNGAAGVQLRQQFGASTGTSGTLSSLSQYAFNMWLRRDGVAATGQLTIDLVDQNGTVIQDQNGVNNTFAVDLSTLTTSYANFGGVFRTPQIMPTSQFVRIRETVAYTNGRSFYMDLDALGQMTQVYTSGPFLALFSGSIPFAIGDNASVTITNSRGAAGTLSTFQVLWAQLYPDMIGSEFLLPSSATPSISDLLIG
jgi:hypothetical protein